MDTKMIFKRCAVIGGLVSVLFLSGCAHMNDRRSSIHFEVQSPSVRCAKLARLKAWRMNGSFSLAQQGEQLLIANYTWHQLNPRDYRIEISSALGLYSASIYHQHGSVTLWKNGVLIIRGKTAKNLMQKTLGWSIPISNLRYWVKGIPAPIKTAGYYRARYDQYGHLTQLKQQGWVICYTAYVKEAGHDIDLPQIIMLGRPGLKVRMTLRDWG